MEVRCVPWEQNCFCLPSSLHDLFVSTSPASCLASTIQLVQFSVRFCCCGSVFFFRIHVPISLLAVSLLVCEALATLVYFSGAVGDTWRSRHCRYVHLRVFRFAPRVALACSVSFPSPCLFLLHRLRWLLLGQGWCSLGRPWWILASLSTSCWNPWGCEHRDGFWLGFLSSVVAVCRMLLLTSRCGQGFFPVARSSDPDLVPCIDRDDGASCAEAGWRVCLCSACLTGPNGVIRLSLFLLALVEIRGRFCPWAFPAWHAGPRVVREWILFCLCPLCSVVSCPSFQVAFSLSPCSQGHNWNFRALVRFVGPCFFFWCLCLTREVET